MGDTPNVDELEKGKPKRMLPLRIFWGYRNFLLQIKLPTGNTAA
jgi:hypothetical protein